MSGHNGTFKNPFSLISKSLESLLHSWVTSQLNCFPLLTTILLLCQVAEYNPWSFSGSTSGHLGLLSHYLPTNFRYCYGLNVYVLPKFICEDIYRWGFGEVIASDKAMWVGPHSGIIAFCVYVHLISFSLECSISHFLRWS